MRVPAAGGMPTPVTALPPGDAYHCWPQFLPDGRHLLYLERQAGAAKGTVFVQELGATQRVSVIQNETRAMWSPPGYLLFVREATLFAQRMNPKSFQLEGEAVSVAEEVTANDANG